MFNHYVRLFHADLEDREFPVSAMTQRNRKNEDEEEGSGHVLARFIYIYTCDDDIVCVD